MKNKILNRLVTVKSIVTLVLTLVFAYLSTVGAIPSDKFQDIFYIILKSVLRISYVMQYHRSFRRSMYFGILPFPRMFRKRL